MKSAKAMVALCALILTAGSVLAQTREGRERVDLSHYIVSAKAGVVNHVEGEVGFKEQAGDWEMLLAGDQLADGDRVRTGLASRAEILLNPGSFVRLSASATVEFSNTNLDDLRIRLERGSIILEIVHDGRRGDLLTVETAAAEIKVERGGIYRIDAGEANVVAYVRKGRLEVMDSEVKDGRKVTIAAGARVIAKFNKNHEDEFDAWSKDRARVLVAANKRLSGIRSAGRPVIANSWIYNPFLGCYTFFPYWYGFSSPYGWSYGVCANPYYWGPRRGVWAGQGSGTGAGTGTGVGGGTSGSVPRGGIGPSPSVGSGVGGSVGGGRPSGAAPSAPRGGRGGN